ncbi:transmembrane protein 218-like [Panonychus citri]|uniref:transmembrane protein 218-like n=1 Tax=Panonychus citri TaxID=50023 RepID=UPI0023074BC2|nr:transmembrane protein 218-like [Panonychus citri]
MRLFGIGSGLFILCLLWALTIIVLMLTTKAKPPFTSLGPVTLLISTLVTTLLLLVPRSPFVEKEMTSSEPIESKPIAPEDLTDWMQFGRSLIIMINLISLVISLALIYSRWITKNMTRLRAPSVDFLQIRELEVVNENNEANGESKSQGKKNKKAETKKTRKK